MPANLENSAVATGLEKVRFHYNIKERQCQKMFKLLHHCTDLTHQQRNTQFFKLDFKSTWTKKFQMFQLDLEKAEEPEIKFPTSVCSSKKLENSRKTSISPSLTELNHFYCVDHNKLWKILKEMGIPYLFPEKPLCKSRSNCRTRHGTVDWFQIGEGIYHSYILSPC